MNKNYILKLAIIFLTLFVIYFLLVQLWNITSTEYKPANALDHVTRIGPTDISDWSKSRRMHD